MLVEFCKAMALILGLALVALALGLGLLYLFGVNPIVGLLVSVGWAWAFGWWLVGPIMDRWSK